LLEPIVSCFVFGSLPSSQLPNVLISAGYTYFVAIAATAAVDLILSYHQRKFLLMFFLVCALVVILCATFAAIFSTISGRPVVAAIPSVIGYFLALFLWWIGNANNAHLLDTPVQPTAATGGDAETKPTGDLTGFNT
jgi:predicted neutral ceramidase superfamily lipid hydrolase